MKPFRLVIVFIFFSAFLVQSASSQVFYLNEDHVKPSKVDEYEIALKEYIDILSTNNFPFPITVNQSTDLVYYISAQIRNTYADIDSITFAFNRIANKDTDAWDNMFNKFNDTYSINKTSCYYFAPALSYIPEEPALAADESIYQEAWFIQIKLGTAAKFNALLKEYVALCKEKGVGYPMNVYRGLIGMNQGTYILCSPAKDPADLWQSEKMTAELLGERGKEIGAQIMKFVDKMEVKDLWWLKKYSYTPTK